MGKLYNNNKTIGIYCPQPHPGGEVCLIKTITRTLSTRYKVNFYTSQEFCKHLHDMEEDKDVSIHTLSNKELAYKRFCKNNKERMLNRVYALLSLVGVQFKKLPLKDEIILFYYPSFEVLLCANTCLVYIHDLRAKYGKQNKIRETLKDYLLKAVLQRSALVVTGSRHTKRDLINFYKIEDGKIMVIPPIPSFSEAGLVEPLSLSRKYGLPDKFIYYPAHMIPMKNHLNLVKAINQIKTLKGEDINLVLVGPTKDEQYYKELLDVIHNYNLDNQIRHLGFLAYEEVLTLYKLATALVMPSLFEGCGIPVLEAFRLGCPVLSSNVTALPEQVGDAGLLFDPNNIEDMAEKIYRVWTDEDLRRDLIRKGYERVKDMTLENYAKKWEEIIEAAL